MSKTNRSAENLLTELYQSGSPFLQEYPWEFESDRWAELLSCSLAVAVGLDADLAREIVESLRQLEAISPDGLAADAPEQRTFIRQVFVQRGCTPAQAGRGADILTGLGRAVKAEWEGYLQRFLRIHGEKMVSDLGAVLRKAGMDGGAATKVAVLWLQNVANIPLLLPEDAYVAEFCKTHKLSADSLVDTADKLGLNVAILDDLLALEALAARETAPKPKRKKRAAAASA